MEEERVKEEIGTIVMRNFGLASLEEIANRILSIKGIRIESDDQSLPENPFFGMSLTYLDRKEDYAEAQENMKQAGFVKCKKREDGS